MSFSLHDLHTIYFCTGARNVPLLDILPQERLVFEFDERMASFKALGAAKAKTSPVGICTTSGTAVSQCLSALIEARYSEVPLVLITGDRPNKQHGTGAPQTINHELITREGRGSYYEVDVKELEGFRIDQPQYPIHINVIVDDTVEHNESVIIKKNIAEFESFLSKHKRPLFLFSHAKKSLRPLVEAFKKTGLPFYAETMSCAHDLSPIRSEKHLLKLFRDGEFDSLVRIGHTPLSKVWRLLETKLFPVASFDSRSLSGLSYGELYPMGPEKLLENQDWWKLISHLSYSFSPDHTETQLEELRKKWPHAEVSTFMKLQDGLSEGSSLYLGNSLIVRHFELTQKKCFHVYGNRGVNGIDGQLATAIGLATHMQEDLTCILGDITAFYDLSSFRELPPNLKVIIINNQGGRIFEGLGLDKRVVLEHHNSFKELCQGMGVSYALNDWSALNKVQVLELTPSLEESTAFRKDWAH